VSRPLHPVTAAPRQSGYDVVIVGGGMVGSSIAWFLSANPDFDGSVLVVERDRSYERASTTLTNSCMRQQFSNAINVQISQFAADFVRNFREYLGGDPEIPDIFFHQFGYMYLASTDDGAAALRDRQVLQAELGAGTRLLSPEEIAAEFPFYRLDDIVLGSHNPVDEGYFDSGTMFPWLQKCARRNGVEFVDNEVVAMRCSGSRVVGVTLASGETMSCGTVVDAAGTRADRVAQMVGASVPVEPRVRYSWVVKLAEPLEQDLPLTIDPSGVHVRSEGDAYQVGSAPDVDVAVDHDDFRMDDDIFEAKVWPVLANRIPAFERLKEITRWPGHYGYNTLDQNAIVGPHDKVENFVFANGFSGHGLQQSPAIGRGVAEYITHGEFRTLDLSPFSFDRIRAGRPFVEAAVI